MRFETAPTDAILLFDGVFLQRPEISSYWDLTVFVDAPFKVTVARMSNRDGATPPDVDALENRRYVEGQKLYLQTCDPRNAAMLVFNNENLASPELITSDSERRRHVLLSEGDSASETQSKSRERGFPTRTPTALPGNLPSHGLRPCCPPN
jgi:hypothetical protein